MVYTEHNEWSTYRGVSRVLNAATYHMDAARFAVSEGVRASVWPFWRAGVDVLVHGIELDRVRAAAIGSREEVRSEIGATGRTVVIGTIANYRKTKDYPTLMRAARLVLDNHSEVMFVAIGQGPQEAEVKRLHAELGLGNRFRLLGYRPDATRLLGGFDVFCLSSHMEGYPVAVMEAFAAGLPIVATAVGGITDAIRHGREGLLVPHENPHALAAALETLARDHALRAGCAEAASRRASDFDIRRAVGTIEDTYRRLAHRPTERPLREPATLTGLAGRDR
jgi:glycosyltransferase involved in cell wall biosynthesis